MHFTSGHPQVLKSARQVREKFNPKNKKHLASFKIFLETGRWGDVQFEVQAPYVSVPHMVLTMFAIEKLGAKAPALPVEKRVLMTEKIIDPTPIADPSPTPEWLAGTGLKLRRVA